VTPRVDGVRPTVADQVMWVLDLFHRVEQRRAGREVEGSA
jgi:hypothetical protein